MDTEPQSRSSGDSSISSGGDILGPLLSGGKKTPREEILMQPDVYIGSIEKRTQKLWVYEGAWMKHREVTYVPGLYKIFDEVLVYAADNKQHDPTMDHLIVEIDAAQCRICVFYDGDGDGIPIEVHSQEEGAYVPEMVFGHLSNCDPNVEEVSGGRSSYGVKLANIFSTEFVVEIADRRRERKYKQVFSENMGKKSEPQVTFSLHGANWTKFTFKPDIAKFDMTHLDDEAIALLGKRVVDIAGILAPTTLQVSFNGKRLPRFLGFPTYVNMYLDAALLSPTWKPTERIPRIIEKFDDQVEVVVSLTEGEFDQVSFVNKAATFAGGPHVDYVLKQITEFVASSLDNKGWGANTEEQEIKRHLWIFINMLVENPTFSPPTKEALVGPLGGLESFKLSDLFLDQVRECLLSRLIPPWSAPERQDKPKRGLKKDEQKRGLKKDEQKRGLKRGA